MPFQEHDLQQLAAHGISVTEARRQLACFRDGFAAVRLDRPATVGDGIEVPDRETTARADGTWATAAAAGHLAKFVPASGAASRMFQFLLAALQTAEGETLPEDVGRFLANADEFAFAEQWRAALEVEERPWPPADRAALAVLLDDSGLGLAQWPKGLIDFHRYPHGTRSAFTEHLHEATRLVADEQGRCCLHFTVNPEARDRIRSHLQANLPEGFTFELSDSLQEPSTDTLAVDLDGKPLRDAGGALVFRAGGHGALLANLQRFVHESGRDVLLLKNIDNVAREEVEVESVDARRMLVGVLLELRREARQWWERLRGEPTESDLDAARDFCRDRLHRDPAKAATDFERRRQTLMEILDRPTRVCGMVRNEGEPGGGPFWVRGADGVTSLQIVEASQVDAGDPEQLAILRAATHFNPVDLVCALRSFADGEPYRLEEYVDPATGFISRKSKDGVELQALERPGLWNGAMAHWNSVFVEVPAATFHPVKTVLDLLRAAHRGN